MRCQLLVRYGIKAAPITDLRLEEVDQVGEEEVIAEHEVECGFRKVNCFMTKCQDLLAKDFEDHVFTAHHNTYGKSRDNPGMWYFVMVKFSSYDTMGVGAHQMWRDQESGLWFLFVMGHSDEKKEWGCFAAVFGGKNVAKKYRVEMRLSSYDVSSSHTFNCDVSSMDEIGKAAESKMFIIPDSQFKIHNRGHVELGDHNKDKNGELTMPVTFKITKKKLYCA